MTSANKNVLRKQNEQAITNRLKIETFSILNLENFFQNFLTSFQ